MYFDSTNKHMYELVKKEGDELNVTVTTILNLLLNLHQYAME